MREDIAGPQGASSRPMWETLEGMVREKAQEFIQQIKEEEVTELLGRGGYSMALGSTRHDATRTDAPIWRRDSATGTGFSSLGRYRRNGYRSGRPSAVGPRWGYLCTDPGFAGLMGPYDPAPTRLTPKLFSLKIFLPPLSCTTQGLLLCS